MLTEIPHLGVEHEVVSDQGAGGLRHNDLSAMPRRAYAGCAMDVETDVVVPQ